jgi:hypothetical protein
MLWHESLEAEPWEIQRTVIVQVPNRNEKNGFAHHSLGESVLKGRVTHAQLVS